MLILRYGPKMYLQEDDQYHRDDDNDDDDDDEPTEDDSSTYNSDNNYDIDADNRDNDASDNSVIDLMMMKKGNESIASLFVNMEENEIIKNNNEKGVFDIDANDIALLQAWKLRRQSMEDEEDDDDVDIGSLSLLDDMASDIMSKSSDLQSTQTTKSYGSNITPKSHHSMETNLIGNKTRSASSSSAGSNMKPSLSSSSLPRRSKNKSRKKKKQFQGPSFHS